MNQAEQKQMTLRLILFFILGIVSASLLEFFVDVLMNDYVLPHFLGSLFGHVSLREVGLNKLLILLVGWMLLILLTGLRLFIQTPGILEILAKQINQMTIDQLLAPGWTETGAKFSMQENFLLLSWLLALLLIYLLPYALTAFLYARFVLKEMRQLREAQERVHERFDADRNLIFSNIAHDLRNPMTTVHGYAKALADGMVTDEKQKMSYLEAIERKSLRMNDLIQLLFDYAKINSRGFELKKETLEVNELMRETVALLYEDIERMGMELDLQISEESWMIQADRLQLSRVIQNLISNALKHNPKGSRVLVASCLYEGDHTLLSHQQVYQGGAGDPLQHYFSEQRGILLVVADTGEAIAPALAKQIFEPFAMGDLSRSSQGGSGLGLSIARDLAKMHGFQLVLVPDFPSYSKAFVIFIPYHVLDRLA